ncbi:hypothetical protein QQG55_16630 [Brugia pahangi]|nr:unnamed protein product [Brugia pahangi]
MIYGTFLLLLHLPLLFAIAILNLHCQAVDATNDYFFRSPKWVNLGPSGGSLVSGRGNFRPGFSSSVSDSRFYLSEPLFAFKRTMQQ